MIRISVLILAITGLSIIPYDNYAQNNSSPFAGKWRGIFTIRDTMQIPFNFEILKDGKVFFRNAKERFESGTIRLKDDSLFIPLDQFDNELAFKIGKEGLQGVYRRQDHTGTALKVRAEKGRTYRFPENNIPPAGNISGKYEAIFITPAGAERNAVVILKQQGNKLTGAFLKVSGDSRYLEGIVEGNNFYLSSFIGSSPGYYIGSFTSDKKISGEQIGYLTKQSFTGVPNENAKLPDAYTLANLNDDYTSLNFSFPDMNGKMVSLSDAKYKNKVVILAITGTWCPNCIDEANFLVPWYTKNRDRGVEVIAIHYERKSDTAFVRKVMSRFRDRFNITYDQVFGGLANGESVKESLPAIKTFVSFPTTIFIDRKGNVAKIHTGYSGPATGKYYDEFKKEFNEEADRLLEGDE